MKNKNKYINCIFIFFILMIIIGGIVGSFTSIKIVNSYENRYYYTFMRPTIIDIKNGAFQNNLELAFTDQLPLSTTMKKAQNIIKNILSAILIDTLYIGKCENKYQPTLEGYGKFGCEKYLVKSPIYLNSNEKYKNQLDIKIEHYNYVINKYEDTDFYIYYIEKDTDINLENNENSGLFHYLKENILIDSNQITNFEIKNSKLYVEYFYKTDHHWNNKGSYKAYIDLTNLLQINENIIEYEKEVNVANLKWYGSKSKYIGDHGLLYNEKFFAYKFNYPEHTTYINGEILNYGIEEDYFNGNYIPEKISYGEFYGGDSAEVIFDYNQKDKENILVIGESYDNAILKLIASHYNKTISIDLRHYKKTFEKSFVLDEYLSKYNIKKVLLIGNIDYFYMNEFMLEVN